MKIQSLIYFVLIIIAGWVILIFTGGCAQIGRPTGGPRDSLPPMLLSAVPENRTTHFNNKTVKLTFDEYVEIKEIQKNLLVSPTPKRNPDVTWKLQEVTIRIRDTLEPNTTYVIDFGNSIQDINEANPFRNYKYVFSTGDYIDSLQFEGNVKIAETGKTDSTMIALLYSDLDDSAVLKHKPRYVSRLDSSGHFHFTNLPPGNYHVFALKDEGGQRYYNNPTYLFAFADSAIKISGETPVVNLLAYAEESPPPKSNSVTKPAKDKPLQLLPSAGSSPQDILSPFALTAPTPFASFDSTALKLTDTLYHEYSSLRVSVDSSNKIISVNFPWQENTDYRLIINENIASDSAGNKIAKTDTIAFKTKKESDYGILRLNFTNLDKFRHPVLQFVTNNNVVNSYPLSGPKIAIPLINPGDYELRILEDDNQNGKWDPGNYIGKRQPEHVVFINQKLNIRANWENEKDIVL